MFLFLKAIRVQFYSTGGAHCMWFVPAPSQVNLLPHPSYLLTTLTIIHQRSFVIFAIWPHIFKLLSTHENFRERKLIQTNTFLVYYNILCVAYPWCLFWCVKATPVSGFNWMLQLFCNSSLWLKNKLEWLLYSKNI